MSSRSLSNSGSSAWVSGSPKRQLNSSTRGPSAVSMSPAYSTPTYGRPSARRPSTAGCKIVRVRSASQMPAGKSGRGCVGAHAAGVRSPVAVQQALVILRGEHGAHRDARR